ncbi:hypothetical protein PRIO_4288 [Paenibacillus riograndensis SBR5]|uniref:Uncharacterized protein n=1 Tax=Paenibacillus riograndensis SBR5 TaxID=1073571 RepID=A0A0E4HFF1_9BACL|nr:hypothetical protein PRIO_4288 [Paenibacillus riograndensis SBR5]
MNLKNEQKGKGMEGKFGTVGAVASAFVCGFPPRTAVIIKKSADGQRPEVQTFSGVTAKSQNRKISSSVYIEFIC